LVKQKCEKGPHWGESESTQENLFKRLTRAGMTYKNQGGTAVTAGEGGGKISAVVDWGDPKKGAGAAANVIIGCKSDEEVMNGVIRAVKGDPDGLEVRGGGVDFVWARMRELESLKGWWNNNKNLTAEDHSVEPLAVEPEKGEGMTPSASAITDATSILTSHIYAIYESLPSCTAFIIYSGSGDPLEMSRLQAMQQVFKREFRIKKWDQLSVHWTDAEEQALRRAANEARNGIGFVCIK
jgi:RNA exonuclease 1